MARGATLEELLAPGDIRGLQQRGDVRLGLGRRVNGAGAIFKRRHGIGWLMHLVGFVDALQQIGHTEKQQQGPAKRPKKPCEIVGVHNSLRPSCRRSPRHEAPAVF